MYACIWSDFVVAEAVADDADDAADADETDPDVPKAIASGRCVLNVSFTLISENTYLGSWEKAVGNGGGEKFQPFMQLWMSRTDPLKDAFKEPIMIKRVDENSSSRLGK